MKKKLVIWGASGHAAVVADAATAQGLYDVVGFLDDINPKEYGKEFCGARILGGKGVIEELKKSGDVGIVLGFGDCAARLRLTAVVTEVGLDLATIIHPRSVVAPHSVIGAGTVVLAGAVVNPRAAIGTSVIVNTSAIVDHDCIIGDGVHICPGVHLAGRVQVGEGAWVGIGATVVDGVMIGNGSIIGAGSLVLRDIPAGVVAYGVPARVVRKVQDHA